MQQLFENPYCTIFLDESVPALYQEWQGFVSGEPLREAHNATVQLLRAHRLNRVLADTRHMRVISQADQQWITESYFPRAIAAGLRRVAILQSEDMFNQTSVQAIMATVIRNTLVQAEHFQDLESARNWLRAD
ncbi:STAS/SEC14 domain-containing protein [Hymenobacter rigui]|uniref:STAS/SEC14 domain-containing protein n=1 Tax=Hymenobacter rigui TaxID=334424 RepID=A0A428KPU8_9BACT|nr:STAS/SEC14 domain-containing protein [Hymenobacter rigui]RSK48504.1 hypothetical protein EI291_12365 [Hymenobacter rigui]